MSKWRIAAIFCGWFVFNAIIQYLFVGTGGSERGVEQDSISFIHLSVIFVGGLILIAATIAWDFRRLGRNTRKSSSSVSAGAPPWAAAAGKNGTLHRKLSGAPGANDRAGP